MHIRYCTFSDHAEAMLAIFNEAIAHTTALYEYEPRTMAVMERWFEVKTRGITRWWGHLITMGH
ncbi:hypothetical protein JCM19237_5689 [Photobacterium aphoticum]|uniref:Uncharacterized protein n=1 Tax=Photobacterium aphoticum TaxID=754436 RepID=A0A090QIN4_9GAMM|nr:hypothetical protein JCM19237_5689 [Photobacterium aphoticum]